MNRSLFLKTLLIAALALVLMVPVAMIRDLIGERQQRRNEAVDGIAVGWGKRQALAGPYLLVPYERFWTDVIRETVDGSVKERRIDRKEARVLRLPVDAVDWSIAVTTSEKIRGIYKARLYSARVEAKGRVSVPVRFGLAEGAGRIAFGTPQLVLGVADPRGLRSVSALSAGGMSSDFAAGPGDGALAAGIHAAVRAPLGGEARTVAFGFSLELAGSEALAVAPLAHDTSLVLRADWPHPSFQGVFLPATHEKIDGGFSARWQVSRYAAQGAERLKGCRSDAACPALAAQEAVVSFIEPVSVYQQLERAAKYGFLFIGLMFAAFFLLEQMRRLLIHPIQYTLVGLALAIFFLLLTALSEHIAFAHAYAIATLACVGLVTWYVVRALRSARIGLAFGAALAGLYGALYVLLKAEDYSLLGGAALLFALLAAVMLATRHVDWYRLTQRETAQNA